MPFQPRSRAIAVLLGCTVLAWPVAVFGQSAETPTRNSRSLSRMANATIPDPNDPTTTQDAGNGDAVATVDAAADPTAIIKADPSTTGINDRALRITGADDIAEKDDFGRLNTRETTVDGLRGNAGSGRDDAPGVRIGTFLLRPSLTQSVATESTRTAGTKEDRSYLQTGIKGTLTSDWSRHALTIKGDGVWQRNISGKAETEPSATLDADLQLDLSNDTTANITGGYRFYREGTDDPNAIDGADVQSGVNVLTGGVVVERDFGLLRGTAGVNVERSAFSDVNLSDGTSVSLKDRDQTEGTLRTRIGYELSPALIPFLEASIGGSRYDQRTDNQGYARDARTYAGKTGVEFDLGEKLKGELGIGYQKVTFEDDRLNAIGAVTVDGNVAWSPQRGTDISVGLSTSVEPSTTAGESGSVAYSVNSTLAHEMRDNLVARLSAAAIRRDYPSGGFSEDETIYVAGTGLTWGLNRYLDLTGDLGYELTARKTNADTRVLRAGIGLTLKR